MIKREIDCDSQIFALTVFNFGSGFVFVMLSNGEVIYFVHNDLFGVQWDA
jgi:hypothetical protein